MTGEAIATISVSVVSLTQLVKWAGLKDTYGPVVVLLLAAVGVVFWGWGQNDFSRLTSFGYFAGWVVVATSASGVYGFTRASAEAVTRVLPSSAPSGGARSEPTVK